MDWDGVMLGFVGVVKKSSDSAVCVTPSHLGGDGLSKC